MEQIVKNFKPQGGKHCITNSLKQIFAYYGFPMSEEMMFGLASGLSFLYINQSASPMINGRTKVFEFEKKLAGRLNVKIGCRSGKKYDRICSAAKRMIDTDNPVLIYVDMPYMGYLGMDQDSHFGGHAVVLFGYDDVRRKFWISDRDNHDHPIRVPAGQIAEDYHLVDYLELEKARSSSYRPFPANNKYLTFDFGGYKRPGKEVLREAIEETCQTMLNPPAQLLGINGIMKFSKEILKWEKFDSAKLRQAGIVNYFQIDEAGGTGGGIFRNMYGRFLTEAAHMLENDAIALLGQEFIRVSELWDDIADDLWQLSLKGDTGLLEKMSHSIKHIYDIEKTLYQSLDKAIGSI
ncbi:BtrH N-terminal domain-containing protein [Dorea sp. D27]|uniref:BtrH N-terminal domain-containing protein n=1 Tax=Dorea sp. D27 TaxID=658665 RepID=UPI0006736DF9|nr:BtrH N-terminal domain-containing protein [Dorea sp. D27]KMZ55789.1 hypothetical protein HMPREF0980_00085 [Dorea sp. D27]